MNRPYLVIVRLGDNSAASQWIQGDRHFDLVIDYYGILDAVPHLSAAVLALKTQGYKYPAIANIIAENPALLSRYSYILLPDDDVSCTTEDINRIFQLASLYDLGLCQPSLRADSFVSRTITLHQPRCRLRLTNWIEAMIPCFRSDVLAYCLDTFGKSRTGWGLDNAWSLRATSKGHKVAILDAVQVVHTRPFGRREPRRLNESLAELESTIRLYKAPEPVLEVLGALDVEGNIIPRDHGDYSAIFRVPPW